MEETWPPRALHVPAHITASDGDFSTCTVMNTPPISQPLRQTAYASGMTDRPNSMPNLFAIGTIQGFMVTARRLGKEVPLISFTCVDTGTRKVHSDFISFLDVFLKARKVFFFFLTGVLPLPRTPRGFYITL